MTRKSLSAITADVGPVPQIPVRDDAPASVDPPGASGPGAPVPPIPPLTPTWMTPRSAGGAGS